MPLFYFSPFEFFPKKKGAYDLETSDVVLGLVYFVITLALFIGLIGLPAAMVLRETTGLQIPGLPF